MKDDDVVSAKIKFTFLKYSSHTLNSLITAYRADKFQYVRVSLNFTESIQFLFKLLWKRTSWFVCLFPPPLLQFHFFYVLLNNFSALKVFLFWLSLDPTLNTISSWNDYYYFYFLLMWRSQSASSFMKIFFSRNCWRTISMGGSTEISRITNLQQGQNKGSEN